jgi:hypothetical protein
MCVNANHCYGARKTNSLPLHACLYVYASCVSVMCVQCVIDTIIHSHTHACTHADVRVCVCVFACAYLHMCMHECMHVHIPDGHFGGRLLSCHVG